MLRLVALILLILLIALQVHLWTGHGGMGDVRLLQQRVGEQKAENAKLKARNDTLSAEVEDLKQGNEAIEERARSELGLIKPGDTFYQVVDPAAGSGGRDGAANANGKR